ncbi:MAG: baseplate J/gp47 family protein [Candidatus Adiutrix sp.]|jgi:uncharacterized phage protein gp47/JayE|nr:baseplate J/gp47 family protein [Candidatus Adiutrix sp.]
MSRLTFNPLTGLVAPETADIRAEVAADWERAFSGEGLPPLNTEPPTPAGQLIDAEVGEIEAKNADVLYLANQFNPRVAEGRWQDALGFIYFLTRKIDEPTVVACQLTGLNGTAIPYGALAQSADGFYLICNHAVTIGSNGAAETTFRCAQTGPIEIAPHSLRTIITTVAGWDSIDNAAAGVVGRDRETRAEFEARRFNSVAANAHGSVSALYGALADLNGVLDVRVLENIGPAPVVKYGVAVPGHGVTVCIYGGEDADIAEIIYRKKDAGCDTGGNANIVYEAADYSDAVYQYKIMRPTPVNFWLKVVLGAGTSLTPALTAAIKTALVDDFYGRNSASSNPRVGLAQTVYASRFYIAVMSLPDVRDLHSIQAALGAGASGYADVITINGNQEPVFSVDNITVTVQAA